ncbi:MAG: adenylyl-sulfate kinase [Mobilitalea sp.]
MGSYENIVKIEEMRRKLEEKDFLTAQKVLDTIDINKIKNMSDLSLMAEVYMENQRYEEAEGLLLKVYSKTKTRKTLYQLIRVSIKTNNILEAERYLAEYQIVAPKDIARYIFRYKIDKAKAEPYVKLIEILKTLKSYEYMEQWAYELAKVYHKAGMTKECVEECSELILWFGEGPYVEKAKMLRTYYSGETGREEIMEELRIKAVKENREQIQEESALEDEDASFTDQEPRAAEYSEEQIEELEENQDEFENNSLRDSFVEEDIEYTFSALEGLEDSRNDFLEQTENEIAEQEVEDTIYQLLQEEDMDEDDKKLDRMSEELGINPEKIFGNFLHVQSVKRQLVKSLEQIMAEEAKNVTILITGTAGSGKTTLAKDIAVFLYKTGKLGTSKLAKINADKLNSMDIMTKKDRLKNCCLVVENASELQRKSIDSILELSEELQGEIAIVLEDNKINLNKLFRECPKLMDLFKNRIHLPQYSQEDLMGFANACLRQQDFSLDVKAESTLQNNIARIAKQSEPHRHLEQIYNLMQSVMNAADIRIGSTSSDEVSRSVRLEDFTMNK